MHPREFYAYSEKDFLHKLRGFRKYAMDQYKAMCELERESTYILALLSGKELKKGMTKYHLMQFAWDDKTKGRSIIANLKGEDRKEAAKELFERQQQILQNFIEKRKN